MLNQSHSQIEHYLQNTNKTKRNHLTKGYH